MTKRSIRIALLVVVALLCQAQPVQADNVADGEAAEVQARAYYRVGAFAEAGVEFVRAYELQQRPTLLFNAALAFEKGADSARASSTYALFLQISPNGTKAPEARARKLILDKRLGRTQVPRDEPGASLQGTDKNPVATTEPATVAEVGSFEGEANTSPTEPSPAQDQVESLGLPRDRSGLRLAAFVGQTSNDLLGSGLALSADAHWELVNRKWGIGIGPRVDVWSAERDDDLGGTFGYTYLGADLRGRGEIAKGLIVSLSFGAGVGNLDEEGGSLFEEDPSVELDLHSGFGVEFIKGRLALGVHLIWNDVTSPGVTVDSSSLEFVDQVRCAYVGLRYY